MHMQTKNSSHSSNFALEQRSFKPLNPEGDKRSIITEKSEILNSLSSELQKITNLSLLETRDRPFLSRVSFEQSQTKIEEKRYVMCVTIPTITNQVPRMNRQEASSLGRDCGQL